MLLCDVQSVDISVHVTSDKKVKIHIPFIWPNISLFPIAC